MSTVLIVGPKCTLATSHAPYGESRWVGPMPSRQTNRRTDGRTPDRYITLPFSLDSASVATSYRK